MQRLKDFSKRSFLLMMIVIGFLAFSSTTEATNFKPYEYRFDVDKETTERFNGIEGIKKLVITFDSANVAASIVSGNESDITVVKVADEATGTPAVPVDIVEKVTREDNIATIQFKNLDYIDYTGINSASYELTINSSNGQYVFPFAVHDLLPGFESIFLVQGQPGTDQINSIFAENPPRDIYVHIPKYYLNKIETIHRHNGVVVDVAASTMTNIDVLTDTAVSRLKVSFNGDPIRDLGPHPSVKGFTMGYASLQDANVETLSEFVVKGYNEYGRLLDEENFKVNSVNNEPLGNLQIKVSNYIKKKANDFGKTYTLYDLMSKPKIFENILSGLSASNLNKLGVTYANQLSSVSVGSIDQLNMALANEKIKTINLTANITAPVGGLVINDNITINGNNNTIDGDVVLSGGTTISLNDLIITGQLTVDPGTEATVIAENVTANGVEVISGGIHSIHLINFKATHGITFNNTAPVRVVLTKSEKLNVTLNSGQEVILEGAYGTVTSIHDDAKLKLNLGTTINGLNVNGAKLTVTHPATISLPSNGGSGELVSVDSGETEPGSGGDNSVTDLGITATLEMVQQNNSVIIEGDFSTAGIDPAALAVSWEVSDATVFGSGTVSVAGQTITITNLDNLTEESIERKVTLIGEYNGEKYKLIVPVKVIQ